MSKERSCEKENRGLPDKKRSHIKKTGPFCRRYEK